jgi:hypothetical protein
MTWAPQQTQISLYNRLTGDSALMVLLGTTVGGTQKVFDHVPDDTAFPFVVIESKPWEDRGSHNTEGLSAEISIHCWYQPGASSFSGRGDKQTQLIQQRIDELLHKYALTISGWNTLILRRSTINILTEPDNVTKHGIQQFKLLIGEQ